MVKDELDPKKESAITGGESTKNTIVPAHATFLRNRKLKRINDMRNELLSKKLNINSKDIRELNIKIHDIPPYGIEILYNKALRDGLRNADNYSDDDERMKRLRTSYLDALKSYRAHHNPRVALLLDKINRK